MTKSVAVYLKDILDAMERVQDYTEEMTQNEFEKRDMVVDAVVRNFEVMGEAVTHLSDEFREEHNHIPWRRIVGMRNVVIHDYTSVDTSILWETITKRIPEVEPELKQLYEDTAEAEEES